MGITRGTVFIGTLLLLTAILTATLGTAVYSGVPAKDHLSSGNDISNGLLGSALGSGPGSVAPGCTNPLLGTWDENGQHTYTFDGTCFYVDQDHTPWPYFGHNERVMTHAGSWYTTTVYSSTDDPGEGYGFIDGKLYFIVKGTTRWEVWWELNKIDFKDPIIGTWDNGYGCQLTFDGSTIHVNERGYTFTYGYHRVWDTVGQSYGRYPHSYGAQVLYLPIYWGYAWYGIEAYYIRNGKLYGCYLNTLNKDYDGYNYWIPVESEAWKANRIS